MASPDLGLGFGIMDHDPHFADRINGPSFYAHLDIPATADPIEGLDPEADGAPAEKPRPRIVDIPAGIQVDVYEFKKMPHHTYDPSSRHRPLRARDQTA